MDLKELQTEVNSRWGSQDTNLCHVSDTNHALVHMMKALGKVADAMNDAEHERRSPRPLDVDKYLADLVICAARFAHGAGVDLNEACLDRLHVKFPKAAHVSGETASEAAKSARDQTEDGRCLMHWTRRSLTA